MGAVMNRHEYLSRAVEMAARGSQLKQSRLDADKVRFIRSNPKGETARQLAQRFGVHYRTIEKVRHFETWSHVV